MRNFTFLKQERTGLFYLSVIFVLLSCFFYLFHILKGRTYDWVYFDSLANLIKSSIIHYQTLPLHDPWACSGNSILSNPQHWLFSPFILLTLLFPPTLGNLLSIVILKIIGFFGCVKYFSRHGISGNLSLLGSALFINASWFALHFAEGHVVFRTFLLLPLIFFYIESPFTKKRLFLLIAVLLFVLLDGGIYPLIFSLIYFFFFYLFNFKKIFLGLRFTRKNLTFVLYLCLGALLISLLKVFPILQSASRMKQQQEKIVLSLSQIFEVFFNPTANSSTQFYDYLRFHEFGLYFGASLTIAFFYLLMKNHFFKFSDKKILALVVLFFWIGTGLGGDYNPYRLISSVPLISKAHVQSRYLIVFFLMFLLLFLKMANRAEKLPRFFYILLVMANIEFLIVNFNSFSFPAQNYHLPLITKGSWHETAEYIPKPTVYFSEGAVSKHCYEPSVTHLYTYSSPRGKNVRQLSPLQGDLRFSSIQLTPGNISFDYQTSKGAKVLVNTHYLEGWSEVANDFQTFNFNNLLGVKIGPGQGKVILTYSPKYLNPLLLLSILGILIFFYAFKRIKNV